MLGVSLILHHHTIQTHTQTHTTAAFIFFSCLPKFSKPNPKISLHFISSKLHKMKLQFFVFVLSLSLIIISVSSSPTIYDVLEIHGLPIGLFPKGITNFTIDQSSGRFEVYLQESCDAKFESNVRYDLNVSGTIKVGQLGELSGIAAQELFLWFPVKGIRVDIPSSGLIYFDVGVVFKQFSVSSFESPRDCTVTGSRLWQSNDLVTFDDRHFAKNRLEQFPNKIGMPDARRAVS